MASQKVFFAIGVPVDVPDKSVSFSFYFEANYPLPNKKNSSEYFEKRSLDRTLAYEILESKFASAGFPGRICLLRTICEVAESQITGNGLVGDLLHILFTPSSSRDEGLPCEISEAESTTDCKYHYRECPISLLDLISHYK
ncbi:uncharacterized protein LOC107274805 isoform X2 [Cephus cinctus]|uniref:Uncharacterized protein LOC107274805 isoform X2 n=1 Tax=Cephus cinctus TaxID=211228 RepID=A0AAJ7CGQ7_CEPCN|nr:uncharacterized protein LOC107274805 isoform X2 [Cephus cinctus]